MAEAAPKLSVNVDHVATLRQARGAPYPSPVEAARLAERAGAHGITVHLRGDRRHIQDADVAELRQTIHGKLNLEMAATDEMIAIALELRPQQVTLVPERPEEITTEGGLDLTRTAESVAATAIQLSHGGIEVSLFLDPDPRQIERLGGLREAGVHGFEINTDRYTRASGDRAQRELEAIADSARSGAEAGFRVYAGHGLTTANVGAVAALPQIQEFNIGHFLISRAVIVGIEEAVREMTAAIVAARP